MQVGLEFWQHKRKMVRAAKDLCYSKDVIEQIEAAETDDEISRIMRNARIKQEYEELGEKDRWIDRVKIKPSKR